MHAISERMKAVPERRKTFPERMNTNPDRMKTVPERLEIVTKNVPTGLTRRRPRCNPGCDHDARDKLRNHAALENDVPTAHDMTRSHRMWA